MVRTPTSTSVTLLGLLIVTAALYSPVWHYGYVYEDSNWLGNTSELGVWHGMRPSRILAEDSALATNAVFGYGPETQHRVNLGLHLLNGVLVYFVASAIAGSTAGPIAAGLFLLHPLNSEAVAYISGRSDLLTGTWVLLATLAVVARWNPVVRAGVCGLALIAAFFTKETGALAIPLIAVTILLLRRGDIARSPVVASLALIISAAILGMSFDNIIRFFHLSWWTSGTTLGAGEYAWYQTGTITRYLSMVVWPVGFTIDHDIVTQSPVWALSGVFAVSLAVAYALALWTVSPTLLWGVAWVLIALFPRLVIKVNEFTTEHQMYVALIGVWIGIGAAWSYWKDVKVSVYQSATYLGRRTMTKRAALLLALVLLATPVSAQVIDTQQVAALSTGSGCATASSCASFLLGASNSVGLQVSGTFVGTLTFEGSADGINWVTVTVTKVSDGTTATTTTGTGLFTMPNVGITGLRARATAWTSGVATVVATRGMLSARIVSPIFGTVTTSTSLLMSSGTLWVAAAAPTISSGFGASPSIPSNNGTAAFTVNVGTGASATSGILGLPTATTGWNCFVNDLTAAAGHVAYNTRQTASTVSTATLENQTTSTGAAIAWAASDILRVCCFAY